MIRNALLIALLAALASAEERMTLHYAGGKQRSVTILAADKEGLDCLYGKNELRVAYTELTAESAFSARKALTPYDDGPARLELAEFGVKLELFPEALEELEIALALGGLDETAFEKREAAIQALEVRFLGARIDALLRSQQKPEVCLAAIKRLKQRYPEHPNNKTYAPQIDALVKRIASEMQAKQDAKTAKQESRELAALRKKVERLLSRQRAALKKADALMAESPPAIEKRQVARVKRLLVEPYGAEKYFKRARKRMRAMVKLDRQFRIVDKKSLKQEYESIEKKLVECYLRVARILLRERNYKGTVKYLRDILFYDPINEEALDMVETIKKNRIRFKASDITNARPRVTGG